MAKRRPYVAELNSQARRRVVAEVRRTQPRCAGCGLPIDLSLDAKRHALGSTVDENIPRSHGGSAVDMGNLLHMHRRCNSIKGSRRLTPEVQAELESDDE